MKRKKIAITLLLYFTIAGVFGASFQWASKSQNNTGMCSDAFGNIYTTGTVPVIKYSGSGQQVMMIAAGAQDTMTGKAVKTDANGNIYLCGRFTSQMTLGHQTVVSKGHTDIFVAKFNAKGDLIWMKTSGGSGFDDCNAMDIDARGNIYITGFYSTSASFGAYSVSGPDYRDVFVVVYDAAGQIKWLQNISGTGSTNDYIESYSIKSVASGSCILSGLFSGSAVFAGTKYTAATGNSGFIACLAGFSKVSWIKTFQDAKFYGLARHNDGDIFAAGSFFEQTDIGSFHLGTDAHATNILLARFDSSGNPRWAQKVGSTTYDRANDLILDSKGNIYLTGLFSDQARFGTTTLSSIGEWDVFAAKYDGSGNKIWVLTLGSTGVDAGQCVSLNKAEDQLFVMGSIQYGSVDFGGTTLQDNNGFSFITGIKDLNTGIPSPGTAGDINIRIFPNPSRGSFYLYSNLDYTAHTWISLYSVSGARIWNTEITGNTGSFRVEDLKTGTYMVVVRSSKGTACHQLIIL